MIGFWSQSCVISGGYIGWWLVIIFFKAHQEILGNGNPTTFLLDPVSTKRSDCRTKIRDPWNPIEFLVRNGMATHQVKTLDTLEPRLPIDQCLMILKYSCWLSSLRFFGLVICLPVISYLRIPHRNITWGFAWLVNQKPSPSNHSLSHLTAGSSYVFSGCTNPSSDPCLYVANRYSSCISYICGERSCTVFLVGTLEWP